MLSYSMDESYLPRPNSLRVSVNFNAKAARGKQLCCGTTLQAADTREWTNHVALEVVIEDRLKLEVGSGIQVR